MGRATNRWGAQVIARQTGAKNASHGHPGHLISFITSRRRKKQRGFDWLDELTDVQ